MRNFKTILIGVPILLGIFYIPLQWNIPPLQWADSILLIYINVLGLALAVYVPMQLGDLSPGAKKFRAKIKQIVLLFGLTLLLMIGYESIPLFR